MSELPVMAKKGPYSANVEEGKKYWWCACGRSKTQPFCDGSHEGTEFTPVEFVAEKNRGWNTIIANISEYYVPTPIHSENDYQLSPTPFSSILLIHGTD